MESSIDEMLYDMIPFEPRLTMSFHVHCVCFSQKDFFHSIGRKNISTFYKLRHICWTVRSTVRQWHNGPAGNRSISGKSQQPVVHFARGGSLKKQIRKKIQKNPKNLRKKSGIKSGIKYKKIQKNPKKIQKNSGIKSEKIRKISEKKSGKSPKKNPEKNPKK